MTKKRKRKKLWSNGSFRIGTFWRQWGHVKLKITSKQKNVVLKIMKKQGEMSIIQPLRPDSS